jgi:hypothetical protein
VARRHDCIRDHGDICPRCESLAEDRKAGQADNGMSDLLADRYEKDVLGL